MLPLEHPVQQEVGSIPGPGPLWCEVCKVFLNRLDGELEIPDLEVDSQVCCVFLTISPCDERASCFTPFLPHDSWVWLQLTSVTLRNVSFNFPTVL